MAGRRLVAKQVQKKTNAVNYNLSSYLWELVLVIKRDGWKHYGWAVLWKARAKASVVSDQLNNSDSKLGVRWCEREDVLGAERKSEK